MARIFGGINCEGGYICCAYYIYIWLNRGWPRANSDNSASAAFVGWLQIYILYIYYPLGPPRLRMAAFGNFTRGHCHHTLLRGVVRGHLMCVRECECVCV